MSEPTPHSGHAWRMPILGLAIGTVAAGIVLNRVDLREAWHVLRGLDPARLWITVLVTVLGIPLRPWRWQVMFPAWSRPRFWRCFRVLALGNLANVVLPARAGDVLRGVAIETEASWAGASRGIGTLALEKILDGLALVGLVFVTFWVMPPPPWLRRLTVVSGSAFGSALLALTLVRARTRWVVGGIRSVATRVHLARAGDRIAALLAGFSDGLSAITSGWHMAAVALLTFGIWVAETLVIWSLADAFRASLPVAGAAVVTAVLGLGLAIPAAPGFLGTYEFFSMVALRLSGIPAEAALAITLAMHAWMLLATSALGLAAFVPGGVTLSSAVWEKARARGPDKMEAVPPGSGRGCGRACGALPEAEISEGASGIRRLACSSPNPKAE